MSFNHIVTIASTKQLPVESPVDEIRVPGFPANPPGRAYRVPL